MCTGRTNGANTYEYIYNGSQLMQMTCNGVVMNFTYINGIPATISYGGNTFYYVVNGQGDITGITDSQGTIQVSYYYDAWGATTSIYNPDSPHGLTLATINPFRYRSYYYDPEISMYYLQSRYYDPTVGRFLNGDKPSYLGANEEILGNNLYTYCANNPINYSDYSGKYIAQVITALIGAMIGAASYVVGLLIEIYVLKRKVSFNGWLLALNIAVGAIDGLLAYSKIDDLLAFVISFLMDFLPSIAGGDKMYEALICAFLVAIVSMCLSGNMPRARTVGKYNNQLLNYLKKDKWKIIRQGIKTFFKKMKKYFVKYMSSSAITAVVGTASHASAKAIYKAMAR